MKIFEIIIPGSWLDTNKGYSKDSAVLFIMLRSAFHEANLAVELYTESIEWRQNEKDNSLRDMDREGRQRIGEQYKDSSTDGWDALREREFDIECRYKIEQWELGRVPVEFKIAKTLIYSKAFVSALDTMGNLICALSKEHGAPQEMKAIVDEFYTGVPYLKGLRNSIQHVEDRAVGVFAMKAKRDEKSSRFFSSFIGDTLFATGKEGSLDGVDVSLKTLEFARHVLNMVIGAYSWEAQKQHWPSLDTRSR